MTSPPDKFFRDHLEHFQKPAPSTAWERIDTGLRRRVLYRRWLTITAALILMLLGVFMVWRKDVTQIQETHDSEIYPQPAQPLPAVKEVIKPDLPEKQVTTPLQEIQPKSGMKKKKAGTILQKDMAVHPQPDPESNEAVHEESAMAVAEVQPVPHNTVEPASPEVLAQPNVMPQTRLVYTAAEVESRFMKKTTSPQATSELKNPSGLRKVIDIAANIKHDDGTYGDLRQKKNEILSLGFLDAKSESD